MPGRTTPHQEADKNLVGLPARQDFLIGDNMMSMWIAVLGITVHSFDILHMTVEEAWTGC